MTHPSDVAVADRSDSSPAEVRRLRHELALARTIIDNAAEAIFHLDAEGRSTFANPAAERMFGWTVAELTGRKLHDLVHYKHPDGSPFPMHDCPLGEVFATGETLKDHEDIFFRRDGVAVPVACSNAAIVRENRVVGSVLIVHDITERRKAEEHRLLLVNELNHRVKNTLTIIQSIARQSFRSGAEGAELAAFEARLSALSAAHNLLTDENWGAASIHPLLLRALGPFRVNPGRLELSGPELRLTPRTAVTFAVAMHELATNAAKYGALSNAAGKVSCTWEITGTNEAPRLRLRWVEAGGPPVSPPARQGFGTRMLERALAAELDGRVTLEYLPEGVRCTVDAPLPPA
ncbi:sensor histidine kinase [Phenylobacterium sp.]|uniref:sensor histidine kinase n=1 Tax=Phenylobacterium sp. TaxID=1871053 RepID=UPI0035AE5D25